MNQSGREFKQGSADASAKDRRQVAKKRIKKK